MNSTIICFILKNCWNSVVAYLCKATLSFFFFENFCSKKILTNAQEKSYWSCNEYTLFFFESGKGKIYPIFPPPIPLQGL